MNSVKKRFNEFDFIKGILMVGVIWGHFCSYTSGLDYEKNLLTTYIRLFQMPLFIFVSGYFQKRIISKDDIIDNIKKIILRLCIPYATWVLISYFISMCFSFLSGSEVSLSIRGVLTHINLLWYIGCLLVCRGIFMIISYGCGKYPSIFASVLIVMALLLMCVPINFFHVQFLYPFYIMGYFIKSSWSNIEEKIYKSRKKWLIIYLVMVIFVIPIGFLFPTKWTFYSESNYIFAQGVNGVLWKFIFVIFRYIVYGSTSILALVIFLWIYKKYREKRWSARIVALGKETLVLYLGHVAILYNVFRPLVACMTNNEGLFSNNSFVRYYILCSLLTSITLVVLLGLIKILGKSKIVKQILCG